MDIKIVERTEEKPQIIIKCQQVNNDIMRLKAYIEMFDKSFTLKKTKNGILLIYLKYYTLNQLIIVLFYTPRTR